MGQAYTYIGDQPDRELWGVIFPRGVAVTVDDPALIAKCEALSDFEAGEVSVDPIVGQVSAAEPLVRENEALKARVAELEGLIEMQSGEIDLLNDKLDAYEGADVDAPDDDYVPTEEQEPEPDLPTIGEGTLPADWRDAHWKKKQAWCRETLGIEVKNGEEANFYLEEALKG